MTYARCPKCHGTGLVHPYTGDRPKGAKPEPSPLPPLRRLQAVDEVARPLPKPLPAPKRLQETDKTLGFLLRFLPSWMRARRGGSDG